MKMNKLLKRIVRKVVRKSVPELSVLRSDLNWNVIESSKRNVDFGKNVKLYSPYHVSDVKIGDYTYIAQNPYISMTTIGKFCSIGPNLVCGWGIHPLVGISTHPMFYSTRCQNGMTLSSVDKVEERKPIAIGNDVFIGANVTILDGVTIGNGAVIGAGAVVSKDIPPYAIAVGCPIQVIKYRFDEATRKKVEEVAWWDGDEKVLMKVERDFFDVDAFLNRISKLATEMEAGGGGVRGGGG